MRNGKRKIFRGLLAGAAAFASLFLALSFSAFAAESVFMNGTVTLSYTPRKTTAEKKEELENCGFSVSVSEDGTSIGFEDSSDIIGALLSPEAIPTERNNLKSNGILSYVAHYAQTDGEYAFSELEVVLDFSGYSATVFKDGFLDGVAYALVGSGHGWYTNLRFSETAGDGYLTLVSNGAALSGEATLLLRGMAGSSSIESTIGGKASTATVSSYSLRIVLPDNAVTFESGSLTVSGVRTDNGQIKNPSKIIIDATDPSKVTLNTGANATGTTVTVL